MVVAIDSRNPAQGGRFFGALARPGSDPDDAKARLPVGDKMTVAHNESRADHADSELIEPRFQRQLVVERVGVLHGGRGG